MNKQTNKQMSNNNYTLTHVATMLDKLTSQEFACSGAHSAADTACVGLVTKDFFIHGLKCSLIICRARDSNREIAHHNHNKTSDSRCERIRIVVSIEVREIHHPDLCGEDLTLARRTLITVP